MNSRTYPDQLEIRPYAGPSLSASVTVPGSKSITNRALVLAALTPMDVDLRLTGALQSEDTEVMVDCLKRLGYVVEPHWDGPETDINFPYAERRTVPASEAELFVANSGTTMRFLCALVAAGEGWFR